MLCCAFLESLYLRTHICVLWDVCKSCGRSCPFWNGCMFLCNLGCYEVNPDIEGELCGVSGFCALFWENLSCDCCLYIVMCVWVL